MHEKPSIMFLLALLLISSGVTQAEPQVYRATLDASFDAENARQGVAVDQEHFYAVNNFALSMHDKATGKIVRSWSGEAEGVPLTHLDSLVEIEGKLYASHSNYPEWPMTSSVEVWESESLRHVETHSFGIARGSFTWVDRHAGSWWGAFANYDRVQEGQDEPYGRTARTQVVRMDDTFSIREAWTLPNEILQRMRPMSNSGGSWGPDGLLYLTGHDRPEVYVMCLPTAGSKLAWVATVEVPLIEGQGIAWDRTQAGRLLWGIRKRDRRVIRVIMPEIDDPLVRSHCGG